MQLVRTTDIHQLAQLNFSYIHVHMQAKMSGVFLGNRIDIP